MKLLRWLVAFAVLGAAGSAGATVRIEVDGVSRALETNVRSFLTLTRFATREDLTDDQVRRLADRAVDEATDALRPFGYYAPVVRSRTSREEENRWIVRLRIQPGEPVMLTEATILIEGSGADNDALLATRNSSAVRRGAQLDHPAYDALRLDLIRAAREQGFLDAQLTRRELLVDPAMRSAVVRLTLETGERYEIGEITLEQDALAESFLQGFLRFSPGQPFLPEKLRATQFALEDSNYFSSISVTTGEIDRVNHLVPIVIRGDRIRRNRYSVRLGYGTDTGPRGKFTWDNRLVNDRGHRMTLETTLSSIKQEAILRYIIPVGDPTLEKLEFSGGYIREEIGDLESERWLLSGGLTQVFGHWQRVLFLQLNQERTIQPGVPDRDDLLLIPGISYASLPPNFLTGWVREAAYYTELSGSPSTLGSDASYLRSYSRAERVWPLPGQWHLRLRGELGASWVDDFSELPASQRFFAGGDRSVRGFALNDLSPEVCRETQSGGTQCDKVGAENKLVGSIEIERDFPRDLRGAIFVDAGNAFDDWGNIGFEYSIGIGIRYRLPMVLIGIDIAQALSESGRSPRLHLNITQVL